MIWGFVFWLQQTEAPIDTKSLLILHSVNKFCRYNSKWHLNHLERPTWKIHDARTRTDRENGRWKRTLSVQLHPQIISKCTTNKKGIKCQIYDTQLTIRGSIESQLCLWLWIIAHCYHVYIIETSVKFSPVHRLSSAGLSGQVRVHCNPVLNYVFYYYAFNWSDMLDYLVVIIFLYDTKQQAVWSAEKCAQADIRVIR